MALTDAREGRADKWALEDGMISLEDCIAFCGLDEDEVAVIREHEHIPEIAATALADYLLKPVAGKPSGP